MFRPLAIAALRVAAGAFMLPAAAQKPPRKNGASERNSQRGVPYAEKRVSTEEDIQALERLIGGRSVPGATIGPQVLRGLNMADWVAYLDAAGYPRESRLPRGCQPRGRPGPGALAENA